MHLKLSSAKMAAILSNRERWVNACLQVPVTPVLANTQGYHCKSVWNKASISRNIFQNVLYCLQHSVDLGFLYYTMFMSLCLALKGCCEIVYYSTFVFFLFEVQGMHSFRYDWSHGYISSWNWKVFEQHHLVIRLKYVDLLLRFYRWICMNICNATTIKSLI